MPESTHQASPIRSPWPRAGVEPLSVPAARERVGVELAERYEHLYVTASGDASCLPWHHAGANGCLTEWLNVRASGLVRPGARTVVVGCGLGDDVIELANRGYDACGFDVSPTCVEWARRRFPAHAERFFLGDVLEPAPRLRARFDLVVEAFTIQSVWPSVREEAFGGVVSLAKPHGIVLMLGRARDDGIPLEECECAPYPLCRSELLERMAALGFSPVHEPECCEDDDDPPRACLRAAFRRE